MRIALNIFSLLNLKEAKRKDRYLQFFLYRTILFCILDLDYEFELAFGMQVCHLSFKKKNCVSVIKIHETHDFPGGTVDKNLPANAGGHGFNIPG